jgi:hypothetical protein
VKDPIKVEVLVIVHPDGVIWTPEDELERDGSGMEWDEKRIQDYMAECPVGAVAYLLAAGVKVPTVPIREVHSGSTKVGEKKADDGSTES